MAVLESILTYFLTKGSKLIKRQNVKWVNMKEKYTNEEKEESRNKFILKVK